MTRKEFINFCGGKLQLNWADLGPLFPGVSERGLKSAIARKNTELSKLLGPHKTQIGRKVFFRTEGVGRALGLIDEVQNESR